MAYAIIGRENVKYGPRGEVQLAVGKSISLRRWQESRTDPEDTMHTTDYETVGYIISGRMNIELEHGKVLELNAGDSWVMPPGTQHRYKVLEELIALEANAPALHGPPNA